MAGPGDRSGDVYVSEIAGSGETMGGNTVFRDDSTSHTSQYGDGWHISWGTSDRRGDYPHLTDHGSDKKHN